MSDEDYLLERLPILLVYFVRVNFTITTLFLQTSSFSEVVILSKGFFLFNWSEIKVIFGEDKLASIFTIRLAKKFIVVKVVFS